MLVVCLLVLWQVNASGRASGPALTASPSSTPTCVHRFRIAFLTDVSGLRAPAEADEYLGAQRSQRADPCIQLQLVTSSRPTDYRSNLQRAADDHPDLVIAASFLLTDAVMEAARDNPTTRFVLLDPQVAPAPADNLRTVMVRRSEAGFLAGALASLVTRSHVVAGVYGLGGAEAAYREGFHRGAAYGNPGATVLDANQGPADGTPSLNPAWGAAQSNTLIVEGADVVLGAVGRTGQGALEGAAQTNAMCIGVEVDEYQVDAATRGCLLTSVLVHLDRMVELEISRRVRDGWQSGLTWFGVSEGVIGFAPYRGRGASITPAVRGRLEAIAKDVANGTLLSQY